MRTLSLLIVSVFNVILVQSSFAVDEPNTTEVPPNSSAVNMAPLDMSSPNPALKIRCKTMRVDYANAYTAWPGTPCLGEYIAVGVAIGPAVSNYLTTPDNPYIYDWKNPFVEPDPMNWIVAVYSWTNAMPYPSTPGQVQLRCAQRIIEFTDGACTSTPP